MARSAAVSIFAVLVACTPLDPIPPNTCGNGVVEPGEDCDLFVTLLGDQLHCAVPEEDHACSYTCAEGGCPFGWQCGADDVCRAASGRFREAPGTPIALIAESFTFGDVDGDGLDDIVSSFGETVTVAYAAREGGFPDRLDIQASGHFGRVGVADLDADGAADLPIAVTNGILVSAGRRDRTFGPFAYAQEDLAMPGLANPAKERIIPVRTSLRAPLAQQLRLVSGDPAPSLALTFSLDVLPDAFPGDATKHVDQIAGRIPVADLDGDGDDEFALAFPSDPQVYLFTSSCDQVACTVVPYAARPVVRFDELVSTGGLSFADLDGDGAIDLFGGTAGDAYVATAYGTAGGGLASSAAQDPRFDLVFGSTRLPLAAGDLDGDGQADFITELNIFLSTQDPLTQQMTLSRFARDAVIDDFNRDGIKDFAVALAYNSGADLYLGTGTRIFNVEHISTPSPTVFVRSGDFDGDLVHDVAVVEQSFNAPEMRVSVAYGSTEGGPSKPVAMGTFASVVRIEPGQVSSNDLITDLIVESLTPEGSRPLAVLTGTSLRRMVSPFALKRAGQTESDYPSTLYAARVVGDDDAIDLVATVTTIMSESMTVSTGIWVVQGSKSPVFDRDDATFIPAEQLPDGPCREVLNGCTFTFATGAGGELIAYDQCSSQDIAVYRFSGEKETLAVECTVTHLAMPVYATSLDLRDIDVDGFADLLIGSGNSFPDTPDQLTAALIAWGSASGFSADLTRVDLPIMMSFGPYTAALLNADADRELEIMIGTPEGVFIANFDPTTRNITLADKPAIPLATNIFTMVAADVNSDGLADLSFSDGSQIYIELSIPASEVTP